MPEDKEKNIYKYIENCPTLKTLEEVSKKEIEERYGSMNFYIATY